MREDQKFTMSIFDSRKQAYSLVECSFTARPIDLPRNTWKWGATLLIHAPHGDQLPGIQIQPAGKERSILEPLTNLLGIPAYTWSLDEGDKIILHGDYSGRDETYTTIWKFTGEKVPFVELTSLQRAKSLLIQAIKEIGGSYPIGVTEFPAGLGSTQNALINLADGLDELCQE
jgi:hypothetical protein